MIDSLYSLVIPFDCCATKISELFDKVVDNFHDSTAIVNEGKEYSYDDLDDLASIISSSISEKFHTCPSHFVGLQTKQHIGFVAAAIAIVKAGATFVPVDPKLPPYQQSYIFKHSQCSIVIIDSLCYTSAVTSGNPRAQLQEEWRHSSLATSNTASGVCWQPETTIMPLRDLQSRPLKLLQIKFSMANMLKPFPY